LKHIKGPSDHVLIVGAGLAGLSAAMHLAGAGRRVTILEKNSYPGGRCGILEKDGYSFDNGPTVLTMPDLMAEPFNALGEDMKDWLELIQVDPLYRAFFHDGSQIDVHAETGKMTEEIRKICGADEAAGYEKYVDFVTKLYKYEINDFIDKNIDSPFNLLTPNLAKLVSIGGFRKLAPKVEQFLSDPRLQKLFSFQAMYAGVSPQEAMALYAVIAYMDSVNGVFFPKGGMNAFPRAMAAAAQKHGVEIIYNTAVTTVEHSHGKATAVLDSNGVRHEFDALVLNPDLPVAYRELLGSVPWNVKRLKYSPSCVTLMVGSSAKYDRLAHHNIHFGNSWESTFKELIHEGKLMTDPSFLVTLPTHDDKSLAPAGKESYYILFPTPNLRADIDWRVETKRYRDQIMRTMESQGYTDFEASIEVEEIITPLEWEATGLEAGAPFASSHTFLQTGPFRPKNMAQGFSNVVFAGSGTQPGVGVPMVLISGKLASARITG